MENKRKKLKMNSQKKQPQDAAKRPVFRKMSIPDFFCGNPCCTVRDPEKEKALKKLLKAVSEKRQEST